MSAPSLRPAVFVKLDKMAPATHGHNIVVKVLEKRVVMERERPNGEKLRLEECLVADDTGCMYFTARNDQCDRLQVGDVVALRNAKVFMHHNKMRLSIDKWGAIKETTTAIPGDVNMERNFSSVEYELVTDE